MRPEADGRTTTERVRGAAGYVAAVMAVVVLYDVAVHYPILGRIFARNNLLVEYPLVIGALLCLHAPRVVPRWLRFVAPAAVVLLGFGACDLFFSFLRRSPRPSDFRNLATVGEFSPGLLATAIIMAAAVAALVLRLAYVAAKTWPRRDSWRRAGVKLAVGLAAILLLDSAWFAAWRAQVFQPVQWSDELSLRFNGRISSFLHHRDQERINRAKLAGAAIRDGATPAVEALFPGGLRRRPNVHLIVLESFLDPRTLEGVRIAPSPMAEELRPFLLEGDRFSRVISPVYGGQSAQAEFELLTGIRALARIASADFNIMQGGEVQGFVRRLKAEGYRTLGTVASSAVYFNAATAYRSIGLDHVEFLGETGAAKAEVDDLLFDGSLFETNLARLRRAAAAEKPGQLFNYVVGIYGHYPYRDNYSKRPDKVVASGGDDDVHRIANQFYYRTQALGRFLAELRTLDPEAIIYVTSDHLPPIFDMRFRPPDGHY